MDETKDDDVPAAPQQEELEEESPESVQPVADLQNDEEIEEKDVTEAAETSQADEAVPETVENDDTEAVEIQEDEPTPATVEENDTEAAETSKEDEAVPETVEKDYTEAVETQEDKPVSERQEQEDEGIEADETHGKKEGDIGSDMKESKVQDTEVTTVVAPTHKNSNHSLTSQKKNTQSTIYVCYCPEAGFLERKIVSDTVTELKENGLYEHVWFDRDEKAIDTNTYLAISLEQAEKCRAAIVFLSESFFSCSQSMLTVKTLLERLNDKEPKLSIYTVLITPIKPGNLPPYFHPLFTQYIDLTNAAVGKSLSEKVSAVIAVFMVELENYVSQLCPPPMEEPEPVPGAYKRMSISSWSVDDLQEWLENLGIREYYRQSMAEWHVDGFLLVSMTEGDLMSHAGIESRAIRKKLTGQVVAVMEKEHRLTPNWHLRCRSQRARTNQAYIVFDPADSRLATSLTRDLSRRGINVTSHTTLGQSREEFLRSNGPLLAAASHVIVLLTEHSVSSPFVFQESAFSEWVGRGLMTAMFNNVWFKMRPSLKALLGDAPAIDFEHQMYEDALSVLINVIRPTRTVSGVVLEQSYLNKMAEGIQPLRTIVETTVPAPFGSLQPPKMARSKTTLGPTEEEPVVFISFQWDMAGKVQEIRRYLESYGLPCWTDILSERTPTGRGLRSSSETETLQGYIQRSMKAASVVVSCVTPKYVQSDNCLKDLTLAEMLHKPVIPVLLRFCPWPPEGAPPPVKRIMHRLHYVDLSNAKLTKQGMINLLDRVRKAVNDAARR